MSGSAKATPAVPALHPIVGSEFLGKRAVGSEAAYRDSRGGGRSTSQVISPPRKRGMDTSDRVVLRGQRVPPARVTIVLMM